MKTDAVFKRAFNDALDLLAALGEGATVPSENTLSASLGISRTTVRKVLAGLASAGLIGGSGRHRVVRAVQGPVERFPAVETVSMAAQVEKRFMDWMALDDPPPGTLISELVLARRFGVATSGIREFLIRFQRFGLVEKRPSGGWVFKGFTSSFALELFEIREMFELRSAVAFTTLSDCEPHWQQLGLIRAEHLALQGEIASRYREFSELDSRFHRLVNSSVPNRFIDGFYDIITLIFHYHYQWNKRDERQRNEVAIREHLAYIDALLSRKTDLVDIACRAHLASAKETLLRSTTGRDAVVPTRRRRSRS
ncbi:MAG: GntR family transcriptional regulator [Geminicoccaceae bacterium]